MSTFACLKGLLILMVSCANKLNRDLELKRDKLYGCFIVTKAIIIELNGRSKFFEINNQTKHNNNINFLGFSNVVIITVCYIIR